MMQIHRAANLNGIAHGFFGRAGGVSTGLYESLNCGPGSKDDPKAVAENRQRVTATFDANAKLATLAQIHSPNVHVVGADWDCPQGDAMVTDRPGIILGILTADCAPVLFADPAARVIGAAHAGGKGAVGGVLEATIAAMRKLGAANIVAAIGPTIAQEHYEVGADFRAAFTAADGIFFAPAARPTHFQFNLPGYIAMRLARAGIENVTDLGLSTYPPGNGFFSFRRATHAGEPDYGRQISALMIKP